MMAEPKLIGPRGKKLNFKSISSPCPIQNPIIENKLKTMSHFNPPPRQKWKPQPITIAINVPNKKEGVDIISP
jgi:hypothetical protein